MCILYLYFIFYFVILIQIKYVRDNIYIYTINGIIRGGGDDVKVQGNGGNGGGGGDGTF